MSSLKIEDVRFSYNHTPVLKDISFSLDKGEFVGLVGPNGSGKTTLLKCISRTLKGTGGRIRLGDRALTDYSTMELGRTVAVVHQGGAVEFSFPVEDIVMMGRHPYQTKLSFGTEDDEKIVDECLKITNTDKFRHRLVQNLSGGEFQRVLIARALAQQPDLMLLDEPTAHLDISHQLDIMDIIARLNRSKKMTILGVFHDLNLAARYCRRILLMHRGKLVADGPLAKVLTRTYIRKVFNINAIVRRNPITNNLYIDPITGAGSEDDPEMISGKTREGRESPDGRTERDERQKRIHIVCGAGTGSELMHSLIDEGFDISTGVLNVLDQDHRTASELNIPTIREAAFSPISEKSHRLNLEMVLTADVIILTGVPIGSANELNLEAVRAAAQKNKIVLLYEPLKKSRFEKRDFTGGSATKIYNEINKSSRRMKTYNELIRRLRS